MATPSNSSEDCCKIPACCSIIPPHILQHIINYADTPEEARAAARFTLAKTRDFHETRIRVARRSHGRQQGGPPAGGQGIVPPHVFQAMASSDANQPDVREGAQRHLQHDEGFRSERFASSEQTTTSAAEGRLNRLIYSSNKHSVTPQDGATLVRKEGQDPVADENVNNVYDYFGNTFDFYFKVFGRNSIDDNGLDMVGSVHYDDDDKPPGYNNAFWSAQGDDMLFGDGDQIEFASFTKNLDVIGHELTHGVTQFTAGLDYQQQCGALNESISDVFGIMVKQYHLGQTSADADWLIGDGMFKDIPGALRSMKMPGTGYNDPRIGQDPQPADMAHYRDLQPIDYEHDYGGVHINSGIPNRAFYLTATALGGHSWERAGKVWYMSLLDPRLKANPEATFQFFANLTIDLAGQIGQDVVDAVTQAWTTVGVLGGGSAGGDGGDGGNGGVDGS